ncbi:MAG: MFS transporter [Gammaproteobacteria bacterium]|nr:MAG: MFS transporter [Gammaproteobacteria bacterium]
MAATSNGARPWPSPGRAWYAVGILVLAFIFSFIDRIIIALLVEPLKIDLSLSDTQLGVLQGLAFAVFYALMGIPIGRLADSRSRRLIIAAGIALWSLMTAVCGLAKNFFQLFLARVGVGVGEAALSPAAYSMISDYFPPRQLGRAMGVYQSGAFFGAGIAFLVGGLVIHLATGAGELVLPLLGTLRPWQLVFIVVGLPGLAVALLMLTVMEPARRDVAGLRQGGIPLPEVLAWVSSNWRLFLAHFGGFALLAVPVTTILTWAPTHFIRALEHAPPDAARTLGLLLLLLSPAGVYAGGWLADLLQQRGHRDAAFRVGILGAVLLLPFACLATTVSDPRLATWLFGPFIFFASLPLAMPPAALQLVVPNQMRAQLSATWMLVLNIVTAGIGPTAVPFVSDRWFAGPDGIGSAMALVNGLSLPLAALALWLGLKHFRSAVRLAAD